MARPISASVFNGLKQKNLRLAFRFEFHRVTESAVVLE